MGFYGPSTTWSDGSQFHDWIRDCFVGETGWTVLHYKSIDSAGRMVTAIQNDAHGFVLVLHRTNTTDNTLGWVCVAEGYDFTGGTVTNPATSGLFSPLPGDVAYSTPVALSAFTTATDAFNYYYASTTTAGIAAVISPNVASFGFSAGTSASAFFTFGVLDPLAPTLEPTPSPLFSVSSAGQATVAPWLAAGNRRNRTARSPLSSTATADVVWGCGVTPWHTAAGWGADVYAPDPTALPSTRAVLYRTSTSTGTAAATDGLGIARGLIAGFRAGSGGITGQQIVDTDGTVWRYAEAGNGSGDNAGRVSPLDGWWRII